MAKWFPGRKLSWLRLSVLIVAVSGIVFAGFQSWYTWHDTRDATARTAWTDGYVDVTATPTFAFGEGGNDDSSNVVLSFIVASEDDPCLPTWGTAYTMSEASAQLDLDRRLAQLRNNGGSAMVSFGGQLNNDLAVGCTEHSALVSAYQAVVERYGVQSIDMDIEGTLVSDSQAVLRQAEAIAELQQDSRDDGDGLDVWLTLPVMTEGLTPDGARTVQAYLAAGVDLAGVNAMTMNYNSGITAGTSMADVAESSLTSLHAQLRSIYSDAELPLGSATLWSKISATPMIGQNEIRAEVFTLADAKQLNLFANEHGMIRLSMWSLNRDRTCAENWPDAQRVSDSCSGIQQNGVRFATVLSADRTGHILHNPIETNKQLVSEDAIVDDPKQSPYPVWNATTAYPAKTKIVWRQNVYESKWWSQGNRPDDPVAEIGSNPWQIIGPVLPNEKPAAAPEIPAGALPEWKNDAVYERDESVIFDGTGFVAKWWTQGDSPDASFVIPDASPWRALTATEIQALGDKD